MIIGLLFNGDVSQRDEQPLIRGCWGAELVEVVEENEEVSPFGGSGEG